MELSQPNFVLIFSILLLTGCTGMDVKPGQQSPKPVTLSDTEAAQRANQIRNDVSVEIDSGLSLVLWASDTLLADPVALDMDNYGRAFVTRTNRRRSSEFDIRGHKDWELASISFQDVEDRRTFLRKTLTPETAQRLGKPSDLNGDSIADWHDLMVESEGVFRIEDKSGDGIADFSQLVATGFQEEVTDVAGAVLYTDEALYVGVAPDLWRMKDTNGDGVMDEKESISHGFQVHIGFGGHNLSGLIMGPDGRLYWGIGDIGFHGFDQDGKEWSYPNEGVIVRCNPDGSDFEVFAHGLRNTHEFVFDDHGNLISVDNDGDHPGESERLVYVVNGADAGWRINWQFGKYSDPLNNDYKVWMDEGMYKPRFADQAAYFVPCIRNYINGPTGMVYNPGTALGTEWKDYFFIVEFNGNPARSGIHAFRLKESGASFDFAGDRKVATGILATGLDIGADGALYFTDWIDGWEKKGRGRIWKMDVKKASLTQERDDTQELLAADFSDEAESSLQDLLGHMDMRVRQKAQFELVNRSASGVFEGVLSISNDHLARIHAVWGLAQLIRAGEQDGRILTAYLRDSDAEVRAQCCKMLGDVRYLDAGEALLTTLEDEEERVRFFAAEALGRIAYEPAVSSLITLLKENDDQDVYIRHAATLALARIGVVDPIIALAESTSRALRIAAVVILRKLRHPAVARFLKDEDEYIVAEAARAINDDLSVETALPQLGDLLVETSSKKEAIIRRAINANLRGGSEKGIINLLKYSEQKSNVLELRLEALAALSTWIKPSVVDRVDGRYRGEIDRSDSNVKALAGPVLARLLKDPNEAIRQQALIALSRLEIKNQIARIESTLQHDISVEVRASSLVALAQLDREKAAKAIQSILQKEKPAVRIAALELIGVLDIGSSLIKPGLNAILLNGSSEEKQAAIAALGLLPKGSVDDQLLQLLDLLIAGKIEGPLQLDLLEAAQACNNAAIDAKIKAYRQVNADQGAIADYMECLEGGNASKGRNVLVRNSAAQCLKCHALQGYGGVAGPPLDGVGARLKKSFILESVVDPSAHLAAGYGVVTVIMLDDKVFSGILEEEDDQTLRIKNSEGLIVAVHKNEIKERINAASSMPPMGPILSKREIRDLLAYLVSIKLVESDGSEGAL